MLNRVTNFVISFSAKCCIIRISEFAVLSTMRHFRFLDLTRWHKSHQKIQIFIYIAMCKCSEAVEGGIHMKRLYQWLALSLVFSMMLHGGVCAMPTAQATASEQPVSGKAETTQAGQAIPDYDAYIAQYGQKTMGSKVIALNAAEAVSESDGPALQQVEEVSALVWQNNAGAATWKVTIAEEGLYALNLQYQALRGKGTDVRMSVKINGEFPFSQAESFTFTRLFRDVRTQENDFERDARDNQIKPKTEEVFTWQTASFMDADGMYSDPLLFYFREGENTLSLFGIEEPIAVQSITLYVPESIPSYEQLTLEPTAFTGQIPETIRVQAEKMSFKSRSSITVGSDRSTPATEPYHPYKIRINTMGGTQWQSAGDKVTWDFYVEKAGYYYMGTRYRQNTVRGFYVSRKIEIDGKPVCAELNQQRFYYGINWQTANFGTPEQDMAFWFDEGPHTVSMEVTLGSMESTIRVLSEAQKRLNEMYRKIIMITSVQPDPYRDYTLETDIPELLSVFSSVAEQLEQESTHLTEITGKSGSEAALIDRLAEQLRSFVKEPYTISSRLSKYRDNVSGLMEWMNSVKAQPLELDYLYLCPYGTEKPAAGAGFWKQLVHEFQSFIGTFIEDYNSIGGETGGKSVEVWVSTGRDMAYIVNRLVQSSFTPKENINVTLKLVSTGILQAVMANNAPDVAMGLGRGMPVNLAMRDALMPLNEFDEYDEVVSWFHSSAMIPYTYRNKAYALPEQQIFHMMFIRTDIFNELGLEIPETWEEVYQIARVLQRNNLQIGLPYLTTDANNLVSTGMSAQNIYPTLLVQRGGSVFKEDGSATALDTPEALEAFEEWVSFYTQYSFPLLKDDYNRFRTGEIPMTITSYTFYNQLVMAAPEIRDEWVMVPIPGIRQADGSINRTECASGTGCVILGDCEDAESAWKFLKWWVSAEVQAEYGLMAEALLGPTGRYATANMEAFRQLPWSSQDAAIIMEQWDQITEIPEIPGGYYVSRNLDNAFRACVYRRENTRETLSTWNKSSNDEIARKRKEFNLD